MQCRKNESKSAILFDPLTASVDGINLIEASAGTGKTYTIEGLYLRLLLEKQIRAANILVVTFTEAATAELRERIAARIRSALAAFRHQDSNDNLIRQLIGQSRDPVLDRVRLKLALAEFDEAAIYTIHGFCLKMLTDFAFESGSMFESEFLTNQNRLIDELAADYWRNHLYDAERSFAEMFLRAFPEPRSLAALIARSGSRPVRHILPRLEQTDPRTVYQHVLTLYREVQELWADERETVCALILGNPHWSRQGKYLQQIPERLELLARFFEENNPFADPGLLGHFTPEMLRRKTNKGGRPPEHPLFNGLARLVAAVAGIPVAISLDCIAYGRQELAARKRQRHLRSYDDLLVDLHEALTGSRGKELAARIRHQFEAALIDEFQDTDPLQYEIFKMVFTGGQPRLFFIGDPKQSIYNFRGADIFAYLQAENDAERRYTLLVNYRSDQDLVRAVNTIFSFRRNAFLEERIGFPLGSGAAHNPVRALLVDSRPQSPMTFWFRPAPEEGDSIGLARQQIVEAVGARITHMLNLGANQRALLATAGGNRYVQPGDIAVLVRTHREARMMQEALTRRRVASVLRVNASIFDSAEFSDIRMIASAIADCRHESKVRGALLTDIMGISGTQLQQWSREEERWEEILERFRTYHESWVESGFFLMMRSFLDREQVRQKLLLLPDGERRLTNVLHVLELFHLAETESHCSMEGLLQWAEKIHLNGAEQDEFEIRLETDREAVQILTVHASKGLEFPVVFVPFSWGRRDINDCFFHDPENRYQLTWDLEKKERHRQYAAREDLAENLRLFYVALTRAKHCCHVVWGDIPRSDNSCFVHLFHEGSQAGRWRDLQRLQAASADTIALAMLTDGPDEPYHAPPVSGADLQCLRVYASLRQDWGITSFSALSSRKRDPQEGLDHDQRQAVVEETPGGMTEVAQERSMLDFPGGTRTGDCFHEIFQFLHLDKPDQEKTAALVRAKLEKYGFDQAWTEVGVRLAGDVAARPICAAHRGAAPFTLSRIPTEQTVREMPFHFPIMEADSRKLAARIAAHCRNNPSHHALLQTMQALEFSTLKGFMKGFIDLVFCYENRFYILDWKTNTLGEQLSDYTVDRLQQAIEGHLFTLQYYIYTVALHKYLRLRLGGKYDFSRHFGGVYYFFLRGISGPDSETGVFYDSLADSGGMIELLASMLSGANG